MAFVGIDVGTAHVKAMAWERGGDPRVAAVGTPWRGDGAPTLDPGDLMEAVMRCVRHALALLRDGPVPVSAVEAMAVASMGEAGLYVDERGRPYGPIEDWRATSATEPAFAALLGVHSPWELFRRTGMAPAAKFGLLRMLAQTPVEPAGRRRYWLSVADYVASRLTGGARVTHASLAARTMAYDLERGRWDADLLAFAGLKPDQLPEVFSSPVAAGAARDLGDGLDGAAVAVAGHDHSVAAFGAAVCPGMVLDSSGSAEPLVLPVLTPVWSPAALDAGVMWQPGLDLTGQAMVGLLPTEGGGAAEAWARRLLGVDVDAWEPRRERAQVRFDPAGWARGQAAWRGLGRSVRAEDLYQAVLEGVADHLVERLHALSALVGKTFSELFLTGGACRHRGWLQLRQARSPVPLRVMQPPEGALFGALRWAVAVRGGAPLPLPRWEPVASPPPRQPEGVDPAPPAG